MVDKRKTFESFQVPAYCIFYGALASNWFAINMLQVVRFLLIYRLSGSTAVTGVLALANAVPALLASLIGGSLADRIGKKYVLLASRVGLAVVALSIALLLSVGYISHEHHYSWWILVVAALFEGGFHGLIMPTNMSIIPEIVKRELVMNAIFLSTMGLNLLRLLGPAIAGFLVDAYGFAADYYLMTGLCVISVCFTIFLPHSPASVAHKGSVIGDTVRGLRHLTREKTMLLIVLFSVCHVVSGQPFNQLLPVFTESILKVSASKLGLLASVSGVGAILGSLVLASLPIRKRGLWLLLSGIVMGIPIIIFAYLPQWYISLLMVPFIGLGQTMHGGFAATLVQTYAEPDYRARVQGFVHMAAGLAGFGTFFAGLLAQAVGVQTSIGGLAVFLTLISIVFMLFGTQLRQMD